MQLKNGTFLQNGKYKIVRKIAQGGFGITYLATQVLLKREVAIKEFFMKDCCERDPGTSKITVGTGSQKQLVEKFRAKFVREAQMIASMNHSHIVHVLDIFEENDTAYYIMEYLPGGSLADKVKKEGCMPEDVAEKYIRQVADALDYIHSRDTVHLDVKPSNILLNADGEAVLIDFGISKHYDTAGEQTSSTPVGISKGYAPLEQSRAGDVSQFRPSTDIYALGATLYHLVSGTVPPDASLVVEDGLVHPAALSDRMWNVIKKSMQPSRKSRPQNISEFLDLLDDEPEVVVQPVVAVHPKKSESEETVVVPPKDTEKSKEPDKPKQTEGGGWVLWLIVGLVVIIAILIAVFSGNNKSTGSVPADHEWVDLGLSVKWATCNVGAYSPEDCGDYYAWGETRTKSDYGWGTYEWCNGTGSSLTKYTYYDGKKRLDYSDDAARKNWGGNWRTPTYEEWLELIRKCVWTWTSVNGINGYNVKGPSGKSIFLPAGGCRVGYNLMYTYAGGYWSSTINASNLQIALAVTFNNSSAVIDEDDWRWYGQSVRPVKD